MNERDALAAQGMIERRGRVLLYPPCGRLIFATDFHGQLEDFRRVVSLYQARRDAGEDVYLLFAGDFVHGPAYEEGDFPDFLGDFHTDGSVAILEELAVLLDEDPRVRSLMGNHEHAHVGGPHTSKFHHDPDEVEFLELALGPVKTAQMRALFEGFSLMALTPCGVMMTHAAPGVADAGLEEIAAAEWGDYRRFRAMDMLYVPIIGELLWPRCAKPEVVDALMARLSHGLYQPRVVVYGHEVVESGWAKEAYNQMVVSTSFGLHRACKTYLELDLGGCYESTAALQEGSELRRLYD